MSEKTFDEQDQAPAEFRPSPQHIIDALQEELAQVNANRIYLLATVKTLQDQFREAQELWVMERQSILAGRRKNESAETSGE